jgi:uncharacterized membrane protein YczE
MRTTLCEKYARHADASKTTLDLMVLIASTMIEEFHHEPTVVFAVLIRIGGSGMDAWDHGRWTGLAHEFRPAASLCR